MDKGKWERGNRCQLIASSYTLVPKFKLISHALHSRDTINAKFLADLADVYVDGAVAHDHFITPYLIQDLITEINAAWLLGKQV